MAELAVTLKNLNIKPKQVQDFTPSPMTLATEIYYTGYHPYTLEPVYCARTKKEKNTQHRFFFWYRPSNRPAIIAELKRINRPDMIKKIYPKG